MMLKYLNHLIHESDVDTDQHEKVAVFELKNDIEEDELDEWAKRFRQNYCKDEDIDFLRKGTGFSREDYLVNRIFPDKTDKLGPATRAGDFSELLVYDYLEFLFGFKVLKERYVAKFNRNSSTQGTDVIGYKINNNSNDVIVTFEVKSAASGNKVIPKLQEAVDHSLKDPFRKAESLNAYKQRYYFKGDIKTALEIERFQDKPDIPYREQYGAVAVHDINTYSENSVKKVDVKGQKRTLIIIKREKLMDLIHDLYERASKCK